MCSQRISDTGKAIIVVPVADDQRLLILVDPPGRRLLAYDVLCRTLARLCYLPEDFAGTVLLDESIKEIKIKDVTEFTG